MEHERSVVSVIEGSQLETNHSFWNLQCHDQVIHDSIKLQRSIKPRDLRTKDSRHLYSRMSIDLDGSIHRR